MRKKPRVAAAKSGEVLQIDQDSAAGLLRRRESFALPDDREKSK
jgi:hypothetical protein